MYIYAHYYEQNTHLLRLVIELSPYLPESAKELLYIPLCSTMDFSNDCKQTLMKASYALTIIFLSVDFE